MKPNLACAALTAGLCFAISAASAKQLSNIDWLASKDDAFLKRAATISGDIIAVLDRCRLRPTEDGKAMIAVPVLLYDGIDKHLTPDMRKFKRAAHVYERAFAIAVQRAGDCKTEKARHPSLYR
ncbi:hypothetical protein [Mesorhizobium sp.]|jgi:hypothetical protein|uniref:hypothetical protein n=1 Tax=Mesorhizobium sp. TaxID=1871066 RepID=UPI0035641E12